MKVIITNKKDLQDIFPKTTQRSKSHTQIHQDLFNEVRNDYSVNNVIEVCKSILYDHEGICLFRFVGKNKDLFFYEFECTAK